MSKQPMKRHWKYYASIGSAILGFLLLSFLPPLVSPFLPYLAFIPLSFGFLGLGNAGALLGSLIILLLSPFIFAVAFWLEWRNIKREYSDSTKSTKKASLNESAMPK